MTDPKVTLRDRLRSTRQQLTSERVHSLSSAIVCHVVGAPFYQRAHTIGLYQPTDNEVDPTSLFLDAVRSQKKIFLPIIEKKDRTLRFVPYLPGDPLRTGSFGILEPITTGIQQKSDRIDLIFQPLVGFDNSGCRLGFGGGYYDRTLLAMGLSGPKPEQGWPILIGLAYGFQELPVVPREPHDRLMGGVVTEHGVRLFVNAL